MGGKLGCFVPCRWGQPRGCCAWHRAAPPPLSRQPCLQPGAVARLTDFITEMEMAIISHGRASYVEISLEREARKMSLLSGAGTVLCRGVDVAGLAGTVPAAAFWRWGHLGVVPLAAPSGAPWGCWGGWQRPHGLFEPLALYSGPCSLPCPPGGPCKR